MNRRYAWIIAAVIAVLAVAFLFWPEQEPAVGTTTPDPDQLGPAGAPEIPDNPRPTPEQD